MIITSNVLPQELVNKILYDFRGLQHPTARMIRDERQKYVSEHTKKLDTYELKVLRNIMSRAVFILDEIPSVFYEIRPRLCPIIITNTDENFEHDPKTCETCKDIEPFFVVKQHRFNDCSCNEPAYWRCSRCGISECKRHYHCECLCNNDLYKYRGRLLNQFNDKYRKRGIKSMY